MIGMVGCGEGEGSVEVDPTWAAIVSDCLKLM